MKKRVLNSLQLQAAIKYAEEDLPTAKTLVEQCSADDPETDVNMGCVLYKEGRYEEACSKFTSAMQVAGFQARKMLRPSTLAV